MDDERINVDNIDFALLLWLAERAKRKAAGVDWSRPAAAQEFLAARARVVNPMSGDYEKAEQVLNWRKTAAIKLAQYFEPHKTRLNRAIETLLGPRSAERYAIRRIKAEHGYRFDIPLAP